MTTRCIHQICFPLYAADITSKKRTVFHLPASDRVAAWGVGDELLLLAAPNFPRCMVAELVDVREERLLDGLEADLSKLATASREEYLSRWDDLHAELPAAGNPTVLRIEFRYGRPADPPEWSLAG